MISNKNKKRFKPKKTILTGFPKTRFVTKKEILVSFLIPAHHCQDLLAKNIPQLVAFLSGQYGRHFEVILIPNPVPEDRDTLEMARSLAKRYGKVKLCESALRAGKGLALKEGFRLAHGKWIFTTDADMPFRLDFFINAEKLLRLGFDFVIGNRRLPESRFRMSKGVLSKIYPRFLTGLLFNGIIRSFFPIHTTDTQAGIKAMTRETADQIFRHQVCPGFFYDVEMILTVQGLGYRAAELPVELHLKDEESTLQIFRAGLQASYWIPRILFHHWKGHYETLFCI
jgi:glycosyltransferase involved in cell wall biosynthesis